MIMKVIVVIHIGDLDGDCSVIVNYEHGDAVLVIGEYQYAVSDLDSYIGAKLYDDCLLIC